MNPVDAHLGNRELGPFSAAEALDSFEAGETATTKTKPTTEARSTMRRAIFEVTSADPPNVPSRDTPEHRPKRRSLTDRSKRPSPSPRLAPAVARHDVVMPVADNSEASSRSSRP